MAKFSCYEEIVKEMKDKNDWRLRNDHFNDVVNEMKCSCTDKIFFPIDKYGIEHYEFAYRVFMKKAKEWTFVKNPRKKKYYFEAISAHQKVKLDAPSGIDKMLNLLAFVATVVALATTIILGVSKVLDETENAISI